MKSSLRIQPDEPMAAGCGHLELWPRQAGQAIWTMRVHQPASDHSAMRSSSASHARARQPSSSTKSTWRREEGHVEKEYTPLPEVLAQAAVLCHATRECAKIRIPRFHPAPAAIGRS